MKDLRDLTDSTIHDVKSISDVRFRMVVGDASGQGHQAPRVPPGPTGPLFLRESQDQNLALTVLHVPRLLDSGSRELRRAPLISDTINQLGGFRE